MLYIFNIFLYILLGSKTEMITNHKPNGISVNIISTCRYFILIKFSNSLLTENLLKISPKRDKNHGNYNLESKKSIYDNI